MTITRKSPSGVSLEIPATTNDMINMSTVEGDTLTEALDALNNGGDAVIDFASAYLQTNGGADGVVNVISSDGAFESADLIYNGANTKTIGINLNFSIPIPSTAKLVVQLMATANMAGAPPFPSIVIAAPQEPSFGGTTSLILLFDILANDYPPVDIYTLCFIMTA
jgi:hypothetical protein